MLLISFNPKCTSDIIVAVSYIEKCLVDVKHWMKANKLKLNDSKTEVVLISTWQQLQKRLVESINVADECIHISGQAKNLGVLFDSKPTMDSHIDTVCKLSHFCKLLFV